MNKRRGLMIAAVLTGAALTLPGQAAHATLIVGPGFQEAGYTPIYELAIGDTNDYSAGAP